jgi:hypothetical protein
MQTWVSTLISDSQSTDYATIKEKKLKLQMTTMNNILRVKRDIVSRVEVIWRVIRPDINKGANDCISKAEFESNSTRI